jgi:lauroyl/myristoyl acyltransferase
VGSYHDLKAELDAGRSCLLFFDGGRFKKKYAETIQVNGVPLIFPTTPLALAQSTGCNIVPVFSRRRAWNRVEFTFYPPMNFSEELTMQKIFDLYWPDLSADPSQWHAVLENLLHHTIGGSA